MQGTFEITVERGDGGAPEVQLLTGWRPLQVGSDRRCGLVIAAPQVAPFHAEIIPGPTGCLLDARGEVWVDGRATPAGGGDVPLPDQSEVRLGAIDGPLLRVRRLAYHAASADEAPLLTAERLAIGDALRDVDFEIRPGELVAILGRSGSGKTTLLQCMAGLLETDGGTLTAGRLPLPGGGDRPLRSAIVPQRDPLFAELTPRQMLHFAARLQRAASDKPLAERIEGLARELALGEVLDQTCGTLSGGQARRVGVAMALIGEPDLLLLDEPDSGLDPYHSGEMMSALRELASRRRLGIVLTTHSLLHQNLMNRVVVLKSGRVWLQGSPPEVAAQVGVRDLHRIYQGLGEEQTRSTVKRYGVVRPRRRALRFSPARVLALIERGALRKARRRGEWLASLALPLALGLVIRLIWWSPPAAGGHGGHVALALVGLLAAIWIGLVAAVRELVDDRARTGHERVWGVAQREVLLAKGTVLAAQVGGQALLLGAVLLTGTWLAAEVLLPGLLLAAACGAALGLAVSAWSPSAGVALRLVPLLMIPQILFSALTGFPLPDWTPQLSRDWVAELTFIHHLEPLFTDPDALEGGWQAATVAASRSLWALGGQLTALVGLTLLGAGYHGRPGRR